MAGPGTGYPLTFRCTKCKRGDWRDRRRGTNYEIIARVASKKRGLMMRSDSEHKYQFRCLDCGHIGWTRHEYAKRRWNLEHK